MKISFVFAPLFLLFLSFFIGGCATAKSEPASADERTIRIISEIPGFSKEDIYEKAKSWVGGSFSDSLDVIRHSDRHQGIVVGMTYIPFVRPRKWSPGEQFQCRFKVIAEVKDERIRISFTEMYLMSSFGVEPVLKTDLDENIRPRLEKSVENFVNSFRRIRRQDNW